MKTFTLDDAVNICTAMFDHYVEPYAYAVMSGELPAITYMIHRTGSRDKDWTASIRLKNTLTISVFRCEVYIDDILRYCRYCKLYLVTESVFRPAALFYMLHGLLQTQHMDFHSNVNMDYESMMSGAGYAAYQFIKEHYDFQDILEHITLQSVWYHSMILTNNYKYAPKDKRVGNIIDEVTAEYDQYMIEHHTEAYRTAKRYKAWINLVDEDGFIRMEPKTGGRTQYLDMNNIRQGKDKLIVMDN